MLISWLKKNQCELINTSDILIFTRNMRDRQYILTLNLVFTTDQFSVNIINWQINENEYSELDHEII